ncbi:hypothetical protein CPTSV76_142 [Enterobacteria phage SV76]|nr:hypothetical protein CPTSV76_142 [Enterobacteria phage SV76]
MHNLLSSQISLLIQYTELNQQNWRRR